MTDYISREAFLEHIRKDPLFDLVERYGLSNVIEWFPAADVVEVNDVAKMLTWLFADYCPCNYNGIDEWLPYVCELSNECPSPKDELGCWKQFVKHYKRRRDGDA